MKRTKIGICILFLAGMLLTVLCGCSILSQDAEEYTTEGAIKIVEDTLYKGKLKCTARFSSSSLSSADLQADLNGAMENNYLFSCMLEDLSTYAEKKLFYTEVTFRLDYSENAEGAGPVLNVSGETQFRNTLAEIMQSNAAKTPILLDSFDFTEESLSAMINEADINCDEAAYEYRNIYYAFYEEKDGRQLMIIWGEPPAEYPEVIEKKAELALEAARFVSEVKERQPSDNVAAYEVIYDMIGDAVSYDYDLAEASTEDPGQLTPDMLRDRTAYGALITGSTVCSGYSRAFKNICDELGLPCWVVTGDCDGMRHAWNAVSVDGETLYIDCTSGDEGGFGMELFLFTEEEARYLGYQQDESCKIPF